MNLLILNHHAEECLEALAPKFQELNIFATTKEALASDFIEKADIMLAIRFSDEIIRKAVKLQWIHSMITGVDYIVNLPSLRKDILLTSTRGIHGPQMSEIAFLLMLALNRNLPLNIKNQGKRVWEQWPTKLLYQKKVGIIGVGVIGKEIARKCKAFGMTVYGITNTKREIEHVDHSFGPDGLLQVMGEVDYFINVVPFTPQTLDMIGARELSAMKPTAYFINIGRGETVDEDALIHALENGVIAGAGLDVFCEEPLPEEHPLWTTKNLIILPHIGGRSDIYVDQALPIFEENLRRFLKGERRDLINVIEWQR
jgi:phosphoglycerate dehydrogenase-like enzyme